MRQIHNVFLKLNYHIQHDYSVACPSLVLLSWARQCNYLNSWKVFFKPNMLTSFDPYYLLVKALLP